MSQFCPDHPRKQTQRYPPIKFLQEKAFAQGFAAHSFASVKVGGRRTPRPSDQREDRGERKGTRNPNFISPMATSQQEAKQVSRFVDLYMTEENVGSKALQSVDPRSSRRNSPLTPTHLCPHISYI